jgi:hypothetical protein
VLGEYPDCGTFDPGSRVEQVGRDLLAGISMSQELRLPRGTQRALHAGQFVHRRVTDLTFNRFAVVLLPDSFVEKVGLRAPKSYRQLSRQRT